jgi:hypothetical protein
MIQLYRKIANFYADRLGVTNRGLIGDGFNGAAFLTDSQTVIKITGEFNEAKVIYDLMKNKYNKHIADYYDVKSIKYKGNKYYGIHMEYLTIDCRPRKLYSELKNWLSKYESGYYEYLKIQDPQDLQKFLNEFSPVITAELRKFTKELIEIELELKKLKISNDDLHGGNLGYKKNGNLAIFDIMDYQKIMTQLNSCDYTMKENIKKYLRLLSEDLLPGGIGDNKTAQDLAMKHHQFVGTIEKEIEIGTKIELEHTDDKDKAREIAIDHITEIPDYYTNKNGLINMEKKLEEGQYNLIKKLLHENSECHETEYIKHRKSGWVILQKGSGEVLSTHDSCDDAHAAMRALQAHKH